MTLKHKPLLITATKRPAVTFIRKLTIESLVLSFFMASLSWAQTEGELTPASDIDWVNLEELTPQQQAQTPDACCGLYIEPEIPARASPSNSVDVASDDFEADANIFTFTGNLKAFYEDAYVQAGSGIYDSNSDTFTLQDYVRIRQPGMLLVGASARMDNLNHTSALDNASYLLHETQTRGSAQSILYTANDNVISIDNGRYTRCEPGDNSWLLAATDLVLDLESARGVARNATLRINNIPIFYTPYLSFPLDDQRATGLLTPAISSSRDGGLDFSIPYYLNLAPNYDATLTPRLIIKRGAMVSLEGRYRGQQWNNVLDLNYLPGDDLYDPVTADTPGSKSPDREDRWLIGYDYYARFSDGWSAVMDYSAVSDQDYFRDLGNGGLYNTTQSYLKRNAQINYVGDNWLFNTKVQGFQVIDPSVSEFGLPYDILPSFTLAGNFDNTFGLEYGIETEYTFFDRDINPLDLSQTQIDNGVLVTGQRLNVEPEISWPWSTPGAFFTPSVKYRYASYQLEDQAISQTDKPTRGILTSSIDSGLIFDREIEFGLASYTQTLEPRLYYLHSEYEDQRAIPIFDSADMTFSFNQLFRDNRFSGKDRVGDSDQLTLALTSRFLDDRGKEKSHISIGQIVYFEDRRVLLYDNSVLATETSTSAIVTEFSYQFNSHWRISSYLEWDTHESSMEAGNFQFRYQSDINHIFNLSYRFRNRENTINSFGVDRQTDQTDISGLWPLTTNWGLIGRWNYDLANNRNLESIIGLEYNNCCWSVSLIARQWIDNDDLFLGELEENNGIFLQFELKGLGSVSGDSVSRILGNAISGYKQHEYGN